MKENWNYRRGDIYLVDLGRNIGSEQGGCRRYCFCRMMWATTSGLR